MAPSRRVRKPPSSRLRAARRGPSRERAADTRRRVARILRILDRRYAGCGLALAFATPLQLLIALILAAQCTDERVNRVTPPLFRKYRTPADWAGAHRRTLETEIRSTGFYKNKARMIQTCCRALVDRFGGRVPSDLDELVSLPGVGRKTANILRGNAFGLPAIGVDTHVKRLAQRLGLSRQTEPDGIEQDLNPLVPDAAKVRFCHLIQQHGRVVCFARAPNCPECPINHLCPYPAQGGARKTATRRAGLLMPGRGS